MRILKKLLIVGIILFAGFEGVIFFFADYGPGENQYNRLLVTFIYFFIFGTLVHLLHYPKTRTAYFLLWSLCIIAFLNFPQMIKEGSQAFMEAIFMIGIPFLGIFLSGKVVHIFKARNHKIKHKK